MSYKTEIISVWLQSPCSFNYTACLDCPKQTEECYCILTTTFQFKIHWSYHLFIVPHVLLSFFTFIQSHGQLLKSMVIQDHSLICPVNYLSSLLLSQSLGKSPMVKPTSPPTWKLQSGSWPWLVKSTHWSDHSAPMGPQHVPVTLLHSLGPPFPHHTLPVSLRGQKPSKEHSLVSSPHLPLFPLLQKNYPTPV